MDLRRRQLRARGGSGGDTEMGGCVSVFAFVSDHKNGVSHYIVGVVVCEALGRLDECCGMIYY